MAIERLVLPEPRSIISPKDYSIRSIGGFITAMHSGSSWTLEPGRHDITPDHRLAVPFAQILTVFKTGIATLRIAHSRISDTELFGVMANPTATCEPNDTIIQIDQSHPVLIQTLDGLNNPHSSPVVGLISYTS